MRDVAKYLKETHPCVHSKPLKPLSTINLSLHFQTYVQPWAGSVKPTQRKLAEGWASISRKISSELSLFLLSQATCLWPRDCWAKRTLGAVLTLTSFHWLACRSQKFVVAYKFSRWLDSSRCVRLHQIAHFKRCLYFWMMSCYSDNLMLKLQGRKAEERRDRSCACMQEEESGARSQRRIEIFWQGLWKAESSRIIILLMNHPQSAGNTIKLHKIIA